MINRIFGILFIIIALPITTIMGILKNINDDITIIVNMLNGKSLFESAIIVGKSRINKINENISKIEQFWNK